MAAEIETARDVEICARVCLDIKSAAELDLIDD